MKDLFQSVDPAKKAAPLAERMRPETLDSFLGQEHLMSENKALFNEIRTDQLSSYILWGPPGCGKTSLANVIAHTTQSTFVPFNAVLGGVKEVRGIVEEARIRLQNQNKRTILFVDEVHRFNKAQQDAFLPHVEQGTIVLIGATTENPSFVLNNALLSRCRVLVMKPLSEVHLTELLHRTWTMFFDGLPLPNQEAIETLVRFAKGDARQLLNAIDGVQNYLRQTQTPNAVDKKVISEILNDKTLLYDRKGEEHYNTISAFIKSMRGSDPDATLHYLARMLEGGEDPRFICRRMMIFASEDIGNADPRALPLAVATAEAFDRIGMPEGWIPIAHCATYLAAVPKSNASYRAYKRAKKDISEKALPEIPLHLRNAPTTLMKDLGYGENYAYPHDDQDHINDRSYLPETLQNRRYYQPSDNGFESKIKPYLNHLRNIRKSR